VSASLSETALRALLPVAAYIVLAPLLWFVFRGTWRELDVDAHEHQRKTLAAGGYDTRPLVLFLITATVLTLQEYYGGRDFFDRHLRPWLTDLEKNGLGEWVKMRKYGDLYSYGWWSFSRVFGYVVLPMATWKLVFRKDSLLDMGLRTRGFLSHAWIYLLCLARSCRRCSSSRARPTSGTTTRSTSSPRAPGSICCCGRACTSRSSSGSRSSFAASGCRPCAARWARAAIFAMCAVLHDPLRKALPRVGGAIVAGIALGSLAMRTRSIYSGFLVHITVALLMDLLALSHRGALPTSFWG
jgi:hypothetical protein